MARATARRVFGAAAKADWSAVCDRDLLCRFAESGDQAAFAALVRRHTNLVLGVCRRSLPAAADAEDACQAVFVVLARRAGDTGWQPSIANWLYTTARRVCRDARVAAERRRKREGRAGKPAAVSPADRMTAHELFAALDDELDRMPAVYREPLVLCYLDGLTREDAAARLGVPAGTVKTRLERGRKRLADALTRRGVGVGLGLLTLAATSPVGASPPALMASVLAAVNGSPSPAAAALARGVAVNGFLTRTKLTVLAVVAVGFGLAAVPAGAEPQKQDKMEKPKAEVKGEAKKPDVKERTITGTVVGPDGKPVVAEMILMRAHGKPEALGKTNADGTYKVTMPPAADAHLLAMADDSGVGFAWVGPRTPSEVKFKLPKDSVVRGRVVDTQGKPVAGATVYPKRVDDYGDRGADALLNYWRAKHPQEGVLGGENSLLLTRRTEFALPDRRTVLAATTDADGKFELRGLGAERAMTLAVRGPGIADAEVLVVNRPDFDPATANKAAADNAERMMPKEMRAGLHVYTLHGPTVTVVAEHEKVIRGVVTDRDTGKPRAGVEVRRGDLTATTDAAGRYTIRGWGKNPRGYTVEVLADADTGYLPSQAEANDTAGYEPITLDLPCVKGIVLSGVMTDKGTGKPVAGSVSAAVMQENPYLKAYPPMDKSGSGPTQTATREDGSYRLVVPPGPVLLMAGPGVAQHEVMYRPPQADPKHPQYFFTRWDTLAYVTSTGGYTPVRGCWVQVLNLSEGEKTATVNVELERAKRTVVKVIDADGKPVVGCDAAGVVPRDLYPIGQEEDADTVSVYGLEAKQERLVVGCDQRRKLVGSLVVKEADQEPVLTLRPGGTVTGRAVGADGKPLAGVTVHLRHLSREAAGVFDLLHFGEAVTTDGDGAFRIAHVVPGHEFRLAFSRGAKTLGPKADQAPRHTIGKPGDTLELGDVKLEPAKE